MMAGIIVLWGIGSIAGPAVAGLIMTPFGGAGLFFYAAGALALLAALMFTRTVTADPVGDIDKEPLNATQATSLALSDLDPRGEDENEQFDLFLAWMASEESDE
jgi:MFS family permease